jgi:hypothetical protein
LALGFHIDRAAIFEEPVDGLAGYVTGSPEPMSSPREIQSEPEPEVIGFKPDEYHGVKTYLWQVTFSCLGGIAAEDPMGSEGWYSPSLVSSAETDLLQLKRAAARFGLERGLAALQLRRTRALIDLEWGVASAVSLALLKYRQLSGDQIREIAAAAPKVVNPYRHTYDWLTLKEDREFAWGLSEISRATGVTAI